MAEYVTPNIAALQHLAHAHHQGLCPKMFHMISLDLQKVEIACKTAASNFLSPYAVCCVLLQRHHKVQPPAAFAATASMLPQCMKNNHQISSHPMLCVVSCCSATTKSSPLQPLQKMLLGSHTRRLLRSAHVRHVGTCGSCAYSCSGMWLMLSSNSTRDTCKAGQKGT
jgi:hypothetical protein